MPPIIRRFALGLVVCAVACIGSPEVFGTYSANISGALSSSFSGAAEAHETGEVETTGHAFLISMMLPTKFAGMEKYQGGLIQIASPHAIHAGEYQALPPGIREAEPNVLSIHFGGPGEFDWIAFDGKIIIRAGQIPVSEECSGEFRARFVSLPSRADTITVAGSFSIKK